MALLLHLTDAHMTTPDDDTLVGDYAKRPQLFSHDDAVTRTELLLNTLQAVGSSLSERERTLDAVIVSGDVTIRGGEAGFTMLDKLLDHLGAARPPDGRIVVVPGNHDVAWSTPPGSPERYENFCKYTRARPYVTPLLDGIDEPTVKAGEFASHYAVDMDAEWLLVPINSSNYCGLLAPASGGRDATDPLAGAGPALRKLFRELSLHDIARVSPWQFGVLQRLLKAADKTIKAAGGDPATFVRIAVIHHHLSPVSTEEEAKTFESILNLGYLRQFLRSHQFDIVLHGHKHTASLYWDHIYSAPDGREGDDHRVLVVSGGTLLGVDQRRNEVCRLLELQPRKHAPFLRIASVPAADLGLPLGSELEWRSIHLWSRDSVDALAGDAATVIRARKLDEVYARVMGLFEDGSGVAPEGRTFNLICQVSDPATLERLPAEYPKIAGVADLDAWFDEIVKWWQLSSFEPSERVRFNHGRRIHAHDQLGRLVELLRSGGRRAGRLVVSLFDPELDHIGDANQRFPSFCLLQFELRRVGTKNYLDCVGFFRKHEMRWWWPVNLGEMRVLQTEVLQRVGGSISNLLAGTITTVSTYAHVDDQPPNVAVPEIDRRLYESEGRYDIQAMAYALFAETMRERDHYVGQWRDLLTELTPPPQPDRLHDLPLAVDGLALLHKQVEFFERATPGHHVDGVVRHLDTILTNNRQYLDKVLQRKVDDNAHEDWARRTTTELKQLRKYLKNVLGDALDA